MFPYDRMVMRKVIIGAAIGAAAYLSTRPGILVAGVPEGQPHLAQAFMPGARVEAPLVGSPPSPVGTAERAPRPRQDPSARVRYIHPAGSGNRSGADPRNAAALADINEMIQRVGPGGTVYLLADAGLYPTTGPIFISHGGAPGHPVKITGINSRGAPARARITGTRTRPYPTSAAVFAMMNHGNEVFRLHSGADHLSFSFLSFQDIGNGAFYVRAKIADLTLEDIAATNVRRFLERAVGVDSTITGLTVRRVSIQGFSKSAFRLDYNTSNVLMEDVLGDSRRQDFDNFPEGIDLSGNVHAVVFRRCTMRNSQQSLAADAFWNGDGFTCEPHTSNILFEDCVASGNTDAGFDIKSNNVTLRRCKSYGNTANFKLWGKQNAVMRQCVSEHPTRRGGAQGPRHLTAPWGANLLVENCRFTDQNPQAVVFHTDANADVDPPLGSTIVVTRSRVNSLGKLSFVDLNSRVLIDGVERSFDGR
jgi:hypothetical protein